MKIVAKDGSKSTTLIVPLTPSSPGCTTSAGTTNCTVNVVLRACANAGDCYTAVVSTYDGVFCNGAPPVCSIPSSANELSAGQTIPFRVGTGKGTAVNLTLSGIPHSMSMTPDALTRANGSQFDLIGPGAHAFTMQMFDVDGNAIVGPGSPRYETSTPTGTLAPITVTAAPSSPNQVWATPPQIFDAAGTATFSITPSFSGQSIDACKEPGAVCSSISITVDMQQMVAFRGLGGVLSLYALDEATPRLTLTGLNATGIGLATDSAGDIFMANGGPAAYSTPLSSGIVSRPVCCPIHTTTTAVTAGPDGTAEFLTPFSTASGLQNIVSTCSLKACTTATYILPYQSIQVLASDAAGDLAYGYQSEQNGLNCFVYAYTAPHYGVPVMLGGSPMSATGCAAFVAMDGLGNVFVADPNNNQIVEYTKSSGYLTSTRIQTGSGTPVIGMFADASGNLFDLVWFETCISNPYGNPHFPDCYLTGTLQETLASSLSAHQGGSFGPDLTSNILISSTTPVIFAMGTGGLYMQFSPNGGLVEFTLPSLSPSYPAPQYSAATYGMLVLP
jgi:hypothetical protein